MNEKKSLSRSHSKWSNFKLTLVCILALLSFACFFVCLSLYFAFDKQSIYLIASLVSLGLTLFSFIGFFFFKR